MRLRVGAPSSLALASFLALFGVASCARKAPGLAECKGLALAVAGVRSERELSPELRAQADDLTRECLVTPYDREFLRCVQESGRFRLCRAHFERRRAER